MDKNIGKNKSKILSGKCSPGMLVMHQKLLDHAKKSAKDAFKTASKRVFQKKATATGDLTGHKIANKVTKASKNSQKKNSETVSNANDKEIPKERYVSPQKRKEIIEDLR